MHGTLISSGLVRLHELDTVYSVEDAHLLFEILTVDAFNRQVSAAEK
jgi:hypothetical protein